VLGNLMQSFDVAKEICEWSLPWICLFCKGFCGMVLRSAVLERGYPGRLAFPAMNGFLFARVWK
jgi:hypothetical protein